MSTNTFTGISPAFEAWAIRHKPTGGYLPMRWGQNRGFSQDGPCTVSFPRLFPSKQSARCALDRWLEGEWHRDAIQYDSYSGEYDGGDLYVTPVEGRRREDMEVVRFHLVDVTAVPDAHPDLRHEFGCFARANKALAAAGEERRHACTCGRSMDLAR